MKSCSYCGRENEDEALRCRECGGTEFGSGATLAFEEIKEEEKDLTWVTLIRCRNMVEADGIATRLRAADIPVFIPDEIALQMLPTTEFVRVQVPPSQYQAAREFLEE